MILDEKMMMLNPTMLKTLAITPDGKCAKHPHVSVLCMMASPTETHPPPLQECECCWKEQQEKKNQSYADVSISPSEAAGNIMLPLPALLQSMTSTTTLPSGSSKSSEAAKKYAQWSDTVVTRWNQVQDIGIGSSGDGMNCSSNSHNADEISLSFPFGSAHGRLSPNPPAHSGFNLSMAVVTEEPEGLNSSLKTANTFPTHSYAESESTGGPPWKRLEQQVRRQEEAIQKLQETVKQQEQSIRQDLQQLIQMVSSLAANQKLQEQSPAPQNSQFPRDIAVGVLENTTGDAVQPLPNLPVVPPVTATSRPGMYTLTDHHPANLFQSVRTIERKPPKPPMRHGSFSTTADSRQMSVESFTNINSMVSSLGNSTLNDATTDNGTSETNNPSTISSPPQNNNYSYHQQQEEVPEATYYAPGVESMLERARSKPLEIIFDASGKISSSGILEDSKNDTEDGEEEKKNDNRRRSSHSPPPPLRQSNSNGSDYPPRGSFIKSSGSRSLAGSSQENSDEEGEEEDNLAERTNEDTGRPRNTSPSRNRAPARIQRNFTPPFESGCKTGSKHPNRQPRRELSVAGVSTEKQGNLKRRSDVYVPPTPPPASTPTQPKVTIEERNTTSTNFGRLHPSNLSKLGANTAPPRREIFATANSKIQISCLTIDTFLVNYDSDRHISSSSSVNYREVANLAVTDKFGDKGLYTGTLREEEIEDESEGGPKKRTVGIPHGSGTMKYEGGRFYKGQWKDGHWHGKGLLKNANGDSYEGDFVYDARHGKGIYKYENGDVFEGDFTEDKRHGKGTFMFHNGSIYRGDFVNGDFEGYGWYEFEDGHYEGEWKGGAYHGIGSLQYTDGGSYTGRFYEGKAHGHGEERDADGTIRRGLWQHGVLSGNL